MDLIRRAIESGDIGILLTEPINQPRQIRGKVVHGDHRGRTLGFPTANLHTTKPLQMARGVYAVRATVRGVLQLGVANVGVRPTFAADQPLTIEVHLLDFNGHLYGEMITVDVVARLRGERTFKGVEALTQQIRLDVAAARKALSQ